MTRGQFYSTLTTTLLEYLSVQMDVQEDILATVKRGEGNCSDLVKQSQYVHELTKCLDVVDNQWNMVKIDMQEDERI